MNNKLDIKETESKIQQDCFMWFHNSFPLLRGLLFHIPNGGYRGRVTGNRLKSIGVVAGIPDFCFVYSGTVHFFELKSESGVTSRHQNAIHHIFSKHGHPVRIIRTLDEFKIAINGIVN